MSCIFIDFHNKYSIVIIIVVIVIVNMIMIIICFIIIYIVITDSISSSDMDRPPLLSPSLSHQCQLSL